MRTIALRMRIAYTTVEGKQKHPTEALLLRSLCLARQLPNTLLLCSHLTFQDVYFLSVK